MDSPIRALGIEHVCCDESTVLSSSIIQLSDSARDTTRARDLWPDERSLNLMFVNQNSLHIIVIDLSSVIYWLKEETYLELG